MTYIQRLIEEPIREALARGKSILLLGARQTGKTTLLKHLQVSDLSYTLLDPERRLSFEKFPNLLRQEILAYKRLNPTTHTPIVIIDEIQKVPALMDAVQLLIDEKEAQFILTGSSVRQLRRHPHFNLLPGRVVNFHLEPLSLPEIWKLQPELNDLLLYGSLPGIYLDANPSNKQIDLESYVTNYLEEEIRSEALVRQLGSFSKFIELAAIESGNQLNISNISQELGVGRHTITEYFQILNDCMLAEKIEPITQSTTRKRLTKAPKYLFFDLGIRRIAAHEGIQLNKQLMGYLFEQYIGLELIRHLRNSLSSLTNLRYWRDHAGPEVDYVIETNKKFIPIEVKMTTLPTLDDAKHLMKFMEQYPCYGTGYIICTCAQPILLADNVIALPWLMLIKVFSEIAK